MATAHLTAQRLRELLHYDPEAGVFTWLVSRGGRAAGQQTGVLNSRGYIYIGVDKRLYKRAHLAWLYMTGAVPNDRIDHRDGDRQNDRFANLRDVDADMNAQNQRVAQAANKSGRLGVTYTASRPKPNQFEAHITIAGKRKYLGIFPSADAAHEAYVTAKRIHHKGCTL